jgi:hypothetical protein
LGLLGRKETLEKQIFACAPKRLLVNSSLLEMTFPAIATNPIKKIPKYAMVPLPKS